MTELTVLLLAAVAVAVLLTGVALQLSLIHI